VACIANMEAVECIKIYRQAFAVQAVRCALSTARESGMARRRRVLPRLLIALVVLAGAAMAAAPLVPLSPLKPAVERRLSEVLGRRVAIDSLRMSLIPRPHLKISGMTASENPAFGDGLFLQAGEVHADLNLLEYVRNRRLAIDGITVRSPQIWLVRNTDGTWSWATLGGGATVEKARGLALTRQILLSLITEVAPEALRHATVVDASVKVIDRASSQQETSYRNIGVSASISPRYVDGVVRGRSVTGEFDAQSEGDGGVEILKAHLPFDLAIESGKGADLSVDGSIGPGPLETKNLSARSFSLTGQLRSAKSSPLTGQGQMAISDLLIRTINLSQQVASALRVSQIGDMNPGTSIADLDTGFQISSGAVNTQGLRVAQLDGLGDARADNGMFKVDSTLTVNYAATIELSADATSQLKAASPMLGLLASILERNSRLSVPINISGDLRSPRIEIDVSRAF
jgi:AsmA-like protein